MIRKASEIKEDQLDGFKGGKGRIVMRPLLDESGMMHHGRKFGRTTLPPGTSIGLHTHRGDSEAWYVIRGKGRCYDAGQWVDVGPGDLMVCHDGESHSLENTGSETLETIALILFTPKD